MAKTTTKRPPPPARMPDALPIGAVGLGNPSRNLSVGGERTTVRLNGASWRAYLAMCEAEGWNRHEVAGWVASSLPDNYALSDALRAVVLAYWARRAGLDLLKDAPT